MPNILNSIWYTSYPPVDADSFAFKALVAWIVKQLGVFPPVLSQVPYISSTVLAPAQLIFRNSDGTKTQAVDAVLSFENPNVTLVVLQEAFGLGVTNAQYVAPTAPVPPPAPPVPPTRLVGPAIDGKPGWFYTVPGDNSPGGTQTVQDGHTYIKEVVPELAGSGAFWFELY